MLDSQIVQALIGAIEGQLLIYGLSDFLVSRSSQPTNQQAGAFLSAAKHQIFIEPIASEQIGYTRNIQKLPVAYTHSKLRSYQISTLVDFDFTDDLAINAHDLAQVVNDMLQQYDTLAFLRGSGVSLVNCGNVRPSFFNNDRDQYEASANFDVLVNVNWHYIKAPDSVLSADVEVERV